MHYALLMYEDDTNFAKRTDPEAAEAYWAGWTAYSNAVAEAGIMVSGAGLEVPATATAVRLVDGEHRVQDGPYADAKEHLGGLFVIDVPDLDAALAWASRAPSADYGTVEVRPLLPPPAG